MTCPAYLQSKNYFNNNNDVIFFFYSEYTLKSFRNYKTCDNIFTLITNNKKLAYSNYLLILNTKESIKIIKKLLVFQIIFKSISESSMDQSLRTTKLEKI